MVDDAKSSKPRVHKIVDRIASYFVPIILVVTVLVFLILGALETSPGYHASTEPASLSEKSFACKP